ncbi:MAG: hypothetical protein K6G34_12315 [Lachnospiraceae bacterium]|nr:hypothetical protein [Lachnospiraceae bacterium]
MKKIVSLLLVVAMTALVLTGCGSVGKRSMGNILYSSGAAVKTGQNGSIKTAEVSNDAYIVMVTDPEGTPVEGAFVQMCSDMQCMMQKTDATGCAVFKQDPGKYTVHILKAAGYVVPKEEFAVPEQYGVMNIVLEKSK